MKRLSLVLVLAIVVCNLFCFSFAETEQITTVPSVENVNGMINDAGNTAMEFAQNIMSQLTLWSLPFCAIGIVWGAVQFFIMGIRNLYKKRQGLLLMFGSMTFYVVVLGVDLILRFMIG